MFEAFVLPGVPLWVFWPFVAAGIIIQGISKSGFAGGAGILSLPLMMLVMPVELVAAVLLPLLILCDMNAIYHHRLNCHWRQALAIFLPACVGIVLGAIVWAYVGVQGVAAWEAPLKRFVGVIAIVFAAYIGVKEYALEAFERLKPGRGAAVGLGVAAGFTSTLAHAAGPLVSLYMFGQGMSKSLFVGTVAWTFTLINLTKLPFYIAVGLIDTGVLLFGAVLVPLIPVGSWLGHWMHHRIAEWAFNRVILVLTVLAAIQLLFNINVVLWLLERVV